MPFYFLFEFLLRGNNTLIINGNWEDMMMKKYDRSLRFMIGVLVLVFGVITLTVSPTLASDPVKVSILTDMSGPYAGITASNVEAAKMAIADFGGKLLGQDIEFVYRDHQCKADVGN